MKFLEGNARRINESRTDSRRPRVLGRAIRLPLSIALSLRALHKTVGIAPEFQQPAGQSYCKCFIVAIANLLLRRRRTSSHNEQALNLHSSTKRPL